MAQISFATLVVIAFLFVTQEVYAKRGCSAFGHSCFGGHGKRSGDTAMSVEERDQQDGLSSRRQLGQEETPPHPGYPRNSINGILQNGDDIIPVRDGGVYDREESAMRELMKYRLRNIVKHWMETYRRYQPNSDEGNFVDTM